MNADEIRTLYRDRQMSLSAVGKAMGRNASTIYEFMKKSGIPLRSRAEAGRLPEARKLHAELARGNKAHLGKKHSAETLAKYSEQRRGKQMGPESPVWKGGRFLDKNGYIRVLRRQHPAATVGGYILEHRLIMEKRLGRFLRPDEVVHHINGKKDDNRDENLMLFADQGKHQEWHAAPRKCMEEGS